MEKCAQDTAETAQPRICSRVNANVKLAAICIREGRHILSQFGRFSLNGFNVCKVTFLSLKDFSNLIRVGNMDDLN